MAMTRVLVPLDLPATMRLPPASAEVRALGGPTMGTTWSVRFVLPPPVALDAVSRAIDRVLAGVTAEMSTWIADSDISRFNSGAPQTWHELPVDLDDVLRYALTIAADTGGYYDPTIGALVDLWGFGPTGPRRGVPEHGVPDHGVPDHGAIDAAAARGGFRRLMLAPGRRALQPGGMQLDLSSIAKGFAVDRIAEALSRLGVADHLVEIGGELKGSGMKPDGSPWWVAIEEPAAAHAGIAAQSRSIVALHGLAIATSGDAQRAFESDGRLFSHTIDPRTGWPVSDRLAAVTVLHRSCMRADALAMALTVLGPDDGMSFAQARGLAARFVIRRARRFEERMTPAFAAMLE